MSIDSWGELIIYSVVGYIVINIVLNIKSYFKKKEKETYQDDSPNQNGDNLAMLKALLDNGILSQEEFDRKKANL